METRAFPQFDHGEFGNGIFNFRPTVLAPEAEGSERDTTDKQTPSAL